MRVVGVGVFKVVAFVLILGLFFGCSMIDRRASSYANSEINYILGSHNTLTKIQEVWFTEEGKYLNVRDKYSIEVFDIENVLLLPKKELKEKKEEDETFTVYEDQDKFFKISFNTEHDRRVFNGSEREGFSISFGTKGNYEERKKISEALGIVFMRASEKSESTIEVVLKNNSDENTLPEKQKIKASINKDGSVSIHNINTNRKIVTIKLFKNKHRGEKMTILGKTYENRYSHSWLAITPKGYYVGSPDAYKYLDVDKYYEKFYRPEVVKLALQWESIESLPSVHDVKSPPKVEILTGVSKTDKNVLTLTVDVVAKDGGVGKIQIFRNGTAIAYESKVLKKQTKGDLRSYEIKLLKGKNEIKALAFDRTNSVSSASKVLNIESTYNEPHKKSIYALVIGVQEVANSRFDLENTISDAKLFEETLNAQKNNGLFHDVHVTRLTSKEETTKENILKELKKFKGIHPEDLFVLYVGSHGKVNDDGKYYLIPSDIEDDSSESIKRYAISEDAIKEHVGNIQTAHKFMVFDTCNAGSIAGTLTSLEILKQNKGVDAKTALNTLYHSLGKGAMIMGASRPSEVANEKYKGHGLFTYVLVNGLKGKEDADLNGDKKIQGSELKKYVYENVIEISSKDKTLHPQVPIINDIGEVFSLSRVE